MTWENHLRAMATRVRQHIAEALVAPTHDFPEFNGLALGIFQAQFEHNPVYRQLCQSRGISGPEVGDWSQIPSVPTSAFKELELSCIPASERTTVFYSSGTSGHQPSQNFHNQDSLEVYEASLTGWFRANVATKPGNQRVLALTPDPRQAPNSSLVHMFETLRRQLNLAPFIFTGEALPDGSWQLDCARTLDALREESNTPVLLLGTAFSYVHLLDYLEERQLKLQLPAGSRVLETGGYKGRSRVLPKAELHRLMTERLGLPDSHIVCEYGMSELSSQAYDRRATGSENISRIFRFPPWTRTRIMSPETGREVSEGETGLLRIFDLANVYSVMAIQTEDLAIRRGSGFELIGRAALAEPRGCSLMASNP